MPAEPDRDAAAHRLPRQARPTSLDEALAIVSRSDGAKPVSIGLLGNAAELLPEMFARGIRPDSADRPDLGARSDQRLSPRRLDGRANGSRRASSDPARRWRRRRRRRWRCHVEAMLDVPARRASRRSITATTSARSPMTRASAMPSRSRASSPPISARCSAAASARSAGRRCRAIPRTSTKTDAKVKELMPDNAHAAPLARHGAREDPLPGAAGADLLGRAGRSPPAGPGVQRDGGVGRALRAGGDRARSSRFGLGRLAQPRDRGDARRQRRGERLAAAQRAAQHRRAARPGCRCTTAAASAWAIRSMPGW